MRSLRLPLALLSALLLCGPAARSREDAPAPPVAKEVPALAARMFEAVGLEAWRDTRRLAFTWHLAPRDLTRAYDWDLEKRRVVVRTGTGEEATEARIPSDRPAEDAPEQVRTLHPMFVNDVYWAAFELMIADDGSRLTDLGARAVPGFDSWGELPALEVAYPGDEGYTGGDRYVLWLGEDHRPRAWAFHKGGAEEPTLVTTRGERTTVNGLSLATRFEKPDGALFIEITGLTAE